MGMVLRGRKGERDEDRAPSPVISLIPKIRFWVSTLPEIKSSLFLNDRDGPQCYIWRIYSPPEPTSTFQSVSSLHFLLCAGTKLPSVMGILIAPTSASKLHLCKCHTEWKDQSGTESQTPSLNSRKPCASGVTLTQWGCQSFLMRLVKH